MSEILFCSDAIHKHKVEEDYHVELKAVGVLVCPLNATLKSSIKI
jgi:hypothetical protein